MKKWEVTHGANKIEVENSISGEKLYVNGELQDEQIGMVAGRSRLWGQLDSGEIIKVSLGGDVKIHCSIFVNNKLVLSE